MPKDPFWTEERDEALKQHLAAGDPYSKIALELFGNATRRGAISGRVARLGIGLTHEQLKEKRATRAALNPRRRTRKKIFTKAVRRYLINPFEHRKDCEYTRHNAQNLDVCDPKTLVELERRHCRFPVSRQNNEWIFCGAKRHNKLSSYCLYHDNIAHDRSTDAWMQAEAAANE